VSTIHLVLELRQPGSACPSAGQFVGLGDRQLVGKLDTVLRCLCSVAARLGAIAGCLLAVCPSASATFRRRRAIRSSAAARFDCPQQERLEGRFGLRSPSASLSKFTVPRRRGLIARCRCQVACCGGHVALVGCVSALSGGALAPSGTAAAQVPARIMVSEIATV
jgi:hypothetical protein